MISLAFLKTVFVETVEHNQTLKLEEYGDYGYCTVGTIDKCNDYNEVLDLLKQHPNARVVTTIDGDITYKEIDRRDGSVREVYD